MCGGAGKTKCVLRACILTHCHYPLLTAHLLPLLPHLLDNHQQGVESEWAPFLQTLPVATLTPILWADEERQQLLRGSRVLQVRMQPGACTGDGML